MSDTTQVLEYRPYGAAAKLFSCKDPEVLLEGPAGTGKSRAVGEYLNYVAESTPGCRILIFRKTRVSLTESFLVEWENSVLWPGHPALKGPTRAHRDKYVYPNGSEVVVGGMDNPTRLFSTQYDIAYCNEATELSEEEWQSLHRALRNWKLDYQQLLGDCNPDAPGHWLNKRCNKGITTRLKSKFEDNPSLRPEYLQRLSENLQGPQRDRLYLGLWTAAQGLVYPMFEPEIHCIFPNAVPVIRWTVASVDWGYAGAGAAQTWGVTSDHRMVLLAEAKRCMWQIDQWADVLSRWYKEYEFVRILCDPSRPDAIDKFNDRLGFPQRGTARLAQEADNAEFAGVDQVTWGLTKDHDGRPRMLFVRDSLREGRCPILDEVSKPCTVIEEFPWFVWMKAADGKPIKEKPEPSCPSDLLDCTRYAAMYVWKRDHTKMPERKTFKPGTWGHTLRHGDVWNRAGQRPVMVDQISDLNQKVWW